MRKGREETTPVAMRAQKARRNNPGRGPCAKGAKRQLQETRSPFHGIYLSFQRSWPRLSAEL